MNFGKRTDEAESKRIVARALELGIRHFDTANAYTDGNSERILGAALKGHRDHAIIATKCGFGRVDGKPEGLSRPRLLSAIDESLKRLDVDSVDIYYLHVPDHHTPIEETLDTLAELIEKKKVVQWGISNYGAWQVLEMIDLKRLGLPKPTIAQHLYNVLIRELDIEWFSFARKYDVRTVIYNPLAGGLLTGKHARDGSTQKGSRFDKNKLYLGRYFTDAMFDRVDQLSGVAKEAELSLLQLAYAWVAGARGVDSVLLGPASVQQLEEGVSACARVLDPEVRARVDALHRDWMGTDSHYTR
jgi:aryl-alcohol dehydrogenase-like predicted oxidoreductase